MKHTILSVIDWFRNLLLAGTMLLPLVAGAAPVDADAARAILSGFVSRLNESTLSGAHTTWQLGHTEVSQIDNCLADYYVFNANDGSRFVVVAGDDRMDEVLAYGNGALDLDKAPEGLLWLLDNYRCQAETLHANPSLMPAPRVAGDNDAYVAPLTSSKWGQNSPYRDQCPTIDDKNCVTGCVATSMAQLMYYWKYPSELPELPSYKTRTNNIQVPALPAATLDWNSMTDEYHSGEYSEAEGAAVAQLMRYCGQAAKMDYGIAISTAAIEDQLAALKLFGYDQEASIVNRSSYSDEEWERMMRDNLLLGCPIIYNGSGNGQSHNFIVDGYDGSDKYSINWGWNGYNNGWFALGAFNVYNDKHVMLTTMRPMVGFGFDFTVDGIHYSKTSVHTVKVTYASTESNDYAGEIIVPATVYYMGVNYDVNEIGVMAFGGSPMLREVVIPSSVASIGSRAFEGCTGLQRVAISNSVNRMGSQLFQGCSSLTSVTLPDGLTDLSANMFKDCTSLTGLVLPTALTTIGPNAFSGCASLSSVAIPEGVTTIGQSAFQDCTGLGRIAIPEGVTSIGQSAFQGCTSLDRIAIPGGVASIAEDAFEGCTSLARVDAADMTSWCAIRFANESANPLSHATNLYLDDVLITDLIIPDDVTAIGNYAFSHDTSLASVTFPRSLATVGQAAFAGCDNLSRVNAADAGSWCAIQFADTLSNPLTIARHLFVNGQEVTELDIPEGCSSIGDFALYNATSLISVMMPSTMRQIGKMTFYGTTMGEIFCLASTPPAMGGPQTFSQAEYQNAFLRVPGTSRELYRTDEMWGRFVNILPVKPDFEQDGFTYAHLDDGCVEISYVKPTALGSQVVIPDTIIHDGVQYTVTGIGPGVFYGRDMISEVDIPATIRSIGEDAFKGCSRLQRVNLHDIGAWCGVELANEYSNPVTVASDMCVDGMRLTFLMIPDGVTSISDRVFEGCYQLCDVFLPSSMNSIGSRAFANISLRNVFCLSTDPPIVKNSNAFSSYYNTTLHILESSQEAYQNHDIWKRFRVKETIAYDLEQDGILYSVIDDTRVSLSFVATTSISGDVIIPSTVIHDGVHYTVAGINPRAFKNRKDIVSVDIPPTVTTIGQDAFYGCDSLRRVNIHDVVAWSQMEIAGTNASPLAYAHHLYLEGEEVTEVVLPDTITRVGSYAFSSCYGLRIVDLGEGVNNIGSGAFRACLYMDSLIVGSAVRDIGGSAFGGCRALRRVNVNDPSMWTLIRFADAWANPFCEKQAIMCCHGEWVYMVEIPDTVTAINDYAFYGCYGLFYIAIPPSVKSIGTDAFDYCYYLQRLYIRDVEAWCGIDFKNYSSHPFLSSVQMLHHYDDVMCDLYVNDELVTDLVIPSSMHEVPPYAFAGFSGLKSVKMSNGVETIGEQAFYECYGLETVDFGHTLKTIGTSAFRECFSLDNVMIPNTVTDIQDAAFVWCKGMKNVQLPRTLKRLKAATFGACQSLNEVVIPNQVTYVGPGAFNYCYSLKRVTIGSSVDTIASERYEIPFDKCDSLEEVICLAKIPPLLYHDAFNAKAYAQATLYVPEESVEAYQTASEWSRFATIVGIEFQEENPADVNGDGEVNIADVNAVIDAILGDVQNDRCDVNGDGEVNIADVNSIIDWILNH